MDEIKIREKIDAFVGILRLRSKEDNVQIIDDDYFDSLLNIELEDIVQGHAYDSFTLFRPYDEIYEINPHIYGSSYNDYAYKYPPTKSFDKTDLKEFQIFRRNYTIYIVGIYKTYPCDWFTHHEDGEDSLICHYKYLFYGVIDCRNMNAGRPFVYNRWKHEMYSKFIQKKVPIQNQSQHMLDVEKFVISPETMELLLNHNDESIYCIPTSKIRFYPMFISNEYFGDDIRDIVDRLCG